MQNFENLNFIPQVTDYVQFPNPQTNEPFNRATQPADKPAIAKHIFAIDSRQRNYSKYPYANEYSVPVPERYRNVTAIELKGAILPRTEYNVNSCNKFIDMNLGDFISDIVIEGLNEVYYFNNINQKIIPPDNTYKFKISNNNPNDPAEISAKVNNGKIIEFIIEKAGSNFNYTNPPSLSLEANILGELRQFTIRCQPIIGLDIPIQIREGQYLIGGNPELYIRNKGIGTTFGAQEQVNNAGTGAVDHPIQSWVPFNLLDELEAGISYAILQTIGLQSNSATPHIFSDAQYCYNRRSIFDKTITWLGGRGTKPTDPVVPDYSNDYPLLFSTRLVSQYPTLKSHHLLDDDTGTLTNFDPSRFIPDSYSTNACNFNRINISNNLLIQVQLSNSDENSFDLDPARVGRGVGNLFGAVTLTAECYKNAVSKDYSNEGVVGPPKQHTDNFTFNIIGAYLVPEKGVSPTLDRTWILALELRNLPLSPANFVNQRAAFAGLIITNDGLLLDPTSYKFDNGCSLVSGKIAKYGLKFASGENQIVNIAQLLGFNKINYSYKYKKNDESNTNGLYKNLPELVQPANINNLLPKTDSTVGTQSCFQPTGLYYRTENDYCMIGDPEYLVLSFRAKYGSSSNIPGINDRVDSQNTSNIDRVFACLIFDSTVPSVLQEMSSGNNNLPIINSAGALQNASCTTYLQNDSSIAYNTNNTSLSTFASNKVNQVLLGGNSGAQNTVYQKTPSNLKAMKGTDFDKKYIEFTQPIAQIFDMSIRFTKFTSWSQGSSNELYNFHGKEHLLLFEITCSDFMTGKRF